VTQRELPGDRVEDPRGHRRQEEQAEADPPEPRDRAPGAPRGDHQVNEERQAGEGQRDRDEALPG